MRKTAKHDDILGEIESYEHKLAAAQECADGWMSAYYRQTARLTRAEIELRDTVAILSGKTSLYQDRLQQRVDSINATLEEIKQ